MPNIAIVNYCNLKCKYCFADDMIHEKSTSITIENFKKILAFVAKTPENHIGLIGGEPTLHPDFESIIKETNRYCKELNTSATLFTNGIMLDKYLPIIGERIGILLNCNSPKYMSDENWKATNELLEHLDALSWLEDRPNGPARVNLGCNVYPGLKEDEYDYIWEIVDKYHISHLRTSVVSPGGVYTDMRSDKEAYYALMKPIFIAHCKNAIKHHCSLNMDCGKIPFCYFTVEEKEIVLEATKGQYTRDEFCEPVIDITSDFKATACFGAWDPIDIRDFDDLHQLRRYLLAEKTLPKAKANCTGKCTTCKKHELLICSGGCLGFANMNKNSCATN